MKTAFENGINMIDTAEAYSGGRCEEELYVLFFSSSTTTTTTVTRYGRGRVIKELGLRRTDLIISTKIFWGLGTRKGANDGGLSRKQ